MPKGQKGSAKVPAGGRTKPASADRDPSYVPAGNTDVRTDGGSTKSSGR